VTVRQADRLASSGNCSAENLSTLLPEDIESPDEIQIAQLMSQSISFVVRCPSCGRAYPWNPKDARDSTLCTGCKHEFSSSFGELSGTPFQGMAKPCS
jgi:transposase-like protein